MNAERPLWIAIALFSFHSLLVDSAPLAAPPERGDGAPPRQSATVIDRLAADDVASVLHLPWVQMAIPCPHREDDTGECTHGPDPAPPGHDAGVRVHPVASAVVEQHRQAIRLDPSLSLCDGDGVSGPRVQVVFARLDGEPDRYADYVDSIRYWVAQMDQMFRDSAAKTGGQRRVRFVHDGACSLVIPNVVLSPAVARKFSVMVGELLDQGYNRDDRKYLVFIDAVDPKNCGVAGLSGDDRPGPSNESNFGPGFARVNAGCWGPGTAAHELMHTLGGVQNSAPNTSRGGHCVDQHDVMCYSDEPYFPPMQTICTPDVIHGRLFDCRDDDYFHTNPPPGSYLDTHWNTARSVFLITDTTPPPPPDCPRTISDVNDWRRVVVACDGRIWQPEIVPGEPCSDFEVTFIAPADGDYLFNGPSTELWVDEDGNGIPDRVVVARATAKVVHVTAGGVYTARSYQPTPGFSLTRARVARSGNVVDASRD
ncbi:MAG: hypothetical protein DYG90_02600 [Chloroflexi bacterium CFX6]|nr:hypothetical protein [Chloroflexi bacterium CFX6]